MIKRVSQIMRTDFERLNLLDSVQKAIELSLNRKQDYFPVLDQGAPIGVVTYKELLDAHPNRIIADTSVKRYPTLSLRESIWGAQNVFDHCDAGALLVMDEQELVGMLERNVLATEISTYFDPLTGLYNSSYLYSSAETLIRKGQEISIVFIDVDNFGQINKGYGHTVGDNVLKEMAQTLKHSIPRDAYLCRYGGDEFAVVTTYDEATCKRFCMHLQRRISSIAYSREVQVSVAVGVSGGRRGQVSLDNPVSAICNLINLASLASTKAKDTKDKLCIEGYIDLDSIA
ncbi:MAG: GGDEF domain-containing protein [Limnochordia bacterium]|nr:GGDEF domain-containing protein [Limnochordia bacterium]